MYVFNKLFETILYVTVHKSFLFWLTDLLSTDISDNDQILICKDNVNKKLCKHSNNKMQILTKLD